MRQIIIFAVIISLLSACAPAPSPTAEPLTMIQASQPAVDHEPAAATNAPPPGEQIQPTATEKPGGRSPLQTPASTSPGSIAAEILGRPSDTSVTINILPVADMEVVISYGTENGPAQTISVMGKANTPTEVTLSNLMPDAPYFYTVNHSDRHTFHTARAAGSTFTFAIQGDSHPERAGKQFNADLYVKTLLSAASIQPDFYFAIGDDFSVDALKNVNRDTVTAQYINQRQWLGLVDAPVFLVNGNHEQASLANLNGTPDNVAVWAQTARNAYYPQPAPDSFYTGNAEPVEHIGLLRNYYAFTWGDALFVVIDPYWHSPQTVDNQFGADRDQKKGRDLWNVTLGDAQYAWFRQTLEASRAKYKFVFAHHVHGTGRGGIENALRYEWGDAANLSKHRPWDKTIHQLMVDNGVSIFFQGHDHIFARQELDGVIYQTLPEPANPNYSWENAEAFESGDKFPNSGHVRVTVAPEGILVEYIRTYLEQPDEVAFSYTVR